MQATLDYILEASACIGVIDFLAARGWQPYPWQGFVFNLPRTPVMVVSTRQAGKTWLLSALAYYHARRHSRSMGAVVCPDQDKAKRVIERVEVQKIADIGSPAFLTDNSEEKGLWNGSIIVALPGTIKGMVSRTVNFLAFDEANLVPRMLYGAATPTQAAVLEPWTYATSSAWWKSGWFWDDWDKGTGGWTRVLVRAKWDIVDRKIVPYLPEAEFKAIWAQKGIHAFYPDTPTKEYLELELTRHPENTIRQQYFCEFQDVQGAVFSDEWITAAFTSTVKPLHDKNAPVDKSVRKLGLLDGSSEGVK